jgi:hypothetical protein
VDEFDAINVNASISMVAEETNGLIDALVSDAESHGFEASGGWMNIPLVKRREFEVVRIDPAAQKADDLQELKLNS